MNFFKKLKEKTKSSLSKLGQKVSTQTNKLKPKLQKAKQGVKNLTAKAIPNKTDFMDMYKNTKNGMMSLIKGKKTQDPIIQVHDRVYSMDCP